MNERAVLWNACAEEDGRVLSVLCFEVDGDKGMMNLLQGVSW